MDVSALPNGSRLNCGRNARGRKAVEPQTKRLAGEGTQFSHPIARQLQAHVRQLLDHGLIPC